MNFVKIFGWALLVAGLFIIGWSLMSSYDIFRGKAAPPEIFKTETKEAPATALNKIPTTPEEIQKEMEKIVGEQLKEILPIETLPKLLNLAVWSMLAFILIFGGGQISILGIKMIKQ